MATKTLNTRIQLKYDSYARWTEKNPTLLKGEIAIATIEAADNQAQNPPTVLFKVGPGAFNSLDWVSAKAADVYSWAKLSWENFVAKILPEIPTVDDLTVDQLVGNAKTTTHGEKISIVTAVAKGEGAHNLDVTTTEITLPEAQDVSDLVSAEATDDDVVILSASASGNKVTISGAHAKVGANATKGATEDVTISGYDATGSIKVPKAIVDEYGHVTGLTEQTLSITMPSEQVITHPEYSVVKDDNSGDYAAVYHLTKDGVNVGAAINIPKDLVVKSGSVDANGNIVLVLNDENGTEITIEAGSLIEYVTSGSQAGDMVFINVSDDHKVTATITDGTVTKAKLTSDVQTSLGKADTAVQPEDLNNYATKDDAKYKAGANIQITEDRTISATDTTYSAKADGGLKLEGTEFAIDDSITFYFNCGDAEGKPLA